MVLVCTCRASESRSISECGFSLFIKTWQVDSWTRPKLCLQYNFSFSKPDSHFWPPFSCAALVQSLAAFSHGPGSLNSNTPLPHIYTLLNWKECENLMHVFIPSKATMCGHTDHPYFRTLVSWLDRDIIMTVLSFLTELQDSTLRGGLGQPVGCLGPVERVLTHLRWRGLLLTETLPQQQVSPARPGPGFVRCRGSRSKYTLWLGSCRAFCCTHKSRWKSGRKAQRIKYVHLHLGIYSHIW